MANKQVQIRGDTESNLNSTTPAAREIAADTSNKELRYGDGVSAGGVIIPNLNSIRNNKYSYITATTPVSVNALILTLAKSIGTLGDGFSCKFKANASVTGPATINVNGTGVKNIYKRSAGTLGALAANDIINGGIYEITYDGTQYQLTSTEAANAILQIGQGDLKTALYSYSVNNGTMTGTSAVYITSAAGEYGFSPQMRNTGNIGSNHMYAEYTRAANTSFATCFKTGLLWDSGGTGTSVVFYLQQRYITASPPFDLGDGEVAGFIYALVNSDGEIKSVYITDVPPWVYNGPTNCRSDVICPKTGKKQRRVLKKRSLEEIISGAPTEYELQTITHKIKNADMNLIPHPWVTIEEGMQVVLIDPMDDRLASLMSYHAAGGAQEIIEAMYSGKIYVDNTPLDRKGPKGLKQVGLRFKYS